MYMSIILLFLLLNGMFSWADLLLLHPADSIELYSSLRFCKNASSVIKEKELEFVSCLTNNVPDHPGILFHHWLSDFVNLYARACTDYKDEYLQCWEPVIQKFKECNSQRADKGVPIIFRTLLQTACKDDMAYTFMKKYKTAKESTSMLIADVDKCKVSNTQWMNACKDLAFMNSQNKCRKFSDIKTCLERVTCKGSTIGGFFKEIYNETGAMLRCGNKKAKASQSIGSRKRKWLK